MEFCGISCPTFFQRVFWNLHPVRLFFRFPKIAVVPLLGLWLGLSLPGFAGNVTITQSRPIEKLDAGGHITGVSMAQVGATYSLVKQDGVHLLVQDQSGNQYLIAADATDYTIPLPAPWVSTNTVVATNAPPVTPALAPAASVVSINAPTPATSPGSDANLSKDDADQIKQINAALGLPLLADTAFWQDNVEDVAFRLRWAKESQTTTQESYRRYAKKDEAVILGASAYSMALYTRTGSRPISRSSLPMPEIFPRRPSCHSIPARTRSTRSCKISRWMSNETPARSRPP